MVHLWEILVHCSGEWWGCWCGRQGVQDTTIQPALLRLFSPASGGRPSAAKGCPAPGSCLQLSWPSWPALPRSLHNWLKLPLAASPRPPSRSPGPIPQQPTFYLRRRNPSTSSSPHHLFAQIQFSPFSPYPPIVSFLLKESLSLV